MSRRWLAGMAVVLMLAAFLMATGKEEGVSLRPGAAPVTALLFDCSGFRRLADRHHFVSEMVALARAVAARRQVLRWGCVDGRPDTTFAFRTRDFSIPLGGDRDRPQDPKRLRARNREWAEALREPFERMVDTGRVWPWSGLLEGLAFPARRSRVQTIWFWTDGEIRDQETGFSLPHASDAEIRREIDAWTPRLQGLHDKTLVIVGGGLGAENGDTARRAEAFFHTLVEQEIGGRLVWARELRDTRPWKLLG